MNIGATLRTHGPLVGLGLAALAAGAAAIPAMTVPIQERTGASDVASTIATGSALAAISVGAFAVAGILGNNVSLIRPIRGAVVVSAGYFAGIAGYTLLSSLHRGSVASGHPVGAA
jgi:hypothetical protein